jgi:hypothetical protein
MLWHAVVCETCGAGFEARRSNAAPRPRFCSSACYWKSGGPAANAPNVQRFRAGQSSSHHRPMVYVGRTEGKPHYVLRSHFVWAQTHPADPILPGEHIHHLDRNWRNDAPANLAKMPASKHSRLHHADVTREEMSRRQIAWHQAHPHAVACSYKCMGRLRTMRTIM